MEDYLRDVDPERFWEELGVAIRGGVIRIVLEKTIACEFSRFIGALDYKGTPNCGSSKWLQKKKF